MGVKVWVHTSYMGVKVWSTSYLGVKVWSMSFSYFLQNFILGVKLHTKWCQNMKLGVKIWSMKYEVADNRHLRLGHRGHSIPVHLTTTISDLLTSPWISFICFDQLAPETFLLLQVPWVQCLSIALYPLDLPVRCDSSSLIVLATIIYNSGTLDSS